ncbi:MAG: ferredoxin-thioredoxin reductase catalytic domain-containing protein [Methanomassiliicoccales archaeon]|jgi:ferredoxin-thioredoxin reductase catalytic subunit|nr:ferredoxin-thioredoxin reductase catalytic domain-containing protein [Methanomassiliicoccales archaeon]
MITLKEVRRRAEADAKSSGCYLNPDSEFLESLLEGLRRNEERYGYPSCPCRLASGDFELDRDIICPCDYRDADVVDFGTCYCGLYVSKDVHEGRQPFKPIPERRPPEKQLLAFESGGEPTEGPKDRREGQIDQKENVERVAQVRRTLWYCKQCGYVAYREDPPHVCPICKAKKEMFEKMGLFRSFFAELESSNINANFERER